MASNVENAYVAQKADTGVFLSAPLGTELSESPTAALDPAFKDHGELAEAGIAIGITRKSNDIKGFNGQVFVDVQTEYSGTFKVTFLEASNVEVKKTLFGDANVEVTPATSTVGAIIHTAHNADQLPLKAFVIQTKYGAKRKRYEIEKGRVSELAEFKDVSSDVTRYEATIKSFENSNGNFVEEYETDGKPTP